MRTASPRPSSQLRRAAITLAAAILAGCSSMHSAAGSCRVTPTNPFALKVQATSPVDLEIQIWNRGPGDVHYEQLTPRPGESLSGTLTPNGGELMVTATEKDLELLVTAPAADAELGYVVRMGGSAQVTVGMRSP